ncbi:hypothetical protein WDU94_000892 [Cyamophila willieti]
MTTVAFDTTVSDVFILIALESLEANAFGKTDNASGSGHHHNETLQQKTPNAILKNNKEDSGDKTSNIGYLPSITGITRFINLTNKGYLPSIIGITRFINLTNKGYLPSIIGITRFINLTNKGYLPSIIGITRFIKLTNKGYLPSIIGITRFINLTNKGYLPY